MSDLDDCLREILAPTVGAVVNEYGGDEEKELDELLAQIKQVFIDAGHVAPPKNGAVLIHTMQTDSDSIRFNGKIYETGQEWAKQTLDSAKDDSGNIDPQMVVEILKELV